MLFHYLTFLVVTLYSVWIHGVNEVAGLENVALGKPAYQSGTIPGGNASKAVDGQTSPHFLHGKQVLVNIICCMSL